MIYFLKKNLNLIFFFYIWQRFSSLRILYVLWEIKILSIFIFLILFKASLPPFQIIFLKFYKSWTWSRFLIFILPNKYPLMLLLSNLNLFNWFFLILIIIPLIFFRSSIRISINLKKFIFNLRIIDSSWFIFFSFHSLKILYLYITLNFFLFSSIFFNLLNNLSIKIFFKYRIKIFFWFIVGIPPLPTFQVKWFGLGGIRTSLVIFIFLNLIFLIYFWKIFYLINIFINFIIAYKKETKRLFILYFLNFIWLVFV